MTLRPLKPNLDDLLRNRRLPWLTLGLILAVFLLAMAQFTQRMRQDIRAQIQSRDAQILHAMVMMQFAEVAADIGAEVREPVDQWTVLLKASRLPGVLAVRLFDTNGLFYAAIPIDATEGSVDADTRGRVLAAEPVAQFRERARRSDIILDTGDGSLAGSALTLLEVTVPFQAGPKAEVVGIGQFVLEGSGMAREFVTLDRRLLAQAAVVFCSGALFIGLSVGWAFRRVQAKHRQLMDRTRDLLRANEELAMAARTSAVGSIAAHLIHGLKNPLSGLHQFVQNQNTTPANGDDAAWRDAAASTRRMQQMVAEVVRVLREEAQGPSYELTLEELAGLIRQRVETGAREAGIALHWHCEGAGELDNRQANLLSLILANLLQNAVQASPRGATVTLELRQVEDRLTCRVSDQGPGLPSPVREHLFMPCQSTREGGTGIGLAISKQLAHHLGAQLRLESSSSAGTVFILELVLAATVSNSPLDETWLRS